ncbi:MAG: hypothetical protein WC523_03975 [Patescibacteria group bacterium]
MKKLLALLFLGTFACSGPEMYEEEQSAWGEHTIKDVGCHIVKGNGNCMDGVCRIIAENDKRYEVSGLVSIGDKFCCFEEAWSKFSQTFVKCRRDVGSVNKGDI